MDRAVAAVGQSVTTDENGLFITPGLLVGTRCRLYANHPDGARSAEQTFEVKDTNPIDLGDIVLRPR